MNLAGPDDASAMRDYYARRAPDYEKIYALPERQHDLALLRSALATRFDGRRVLDVACGTGYWSACYAARARATLGVDANQEVLDLLVQKRLPNCTVRRCDCFELPDDLGRFDGAFAGFWFSHIARADRMRFFRGLGERLAPGARVVMIDNRYVAGSSTPIEQRDAAGDTWQLRPLADGSLHRVLKNFPQREELLEQVVHQAAGTHWWLTDYYWWFEYELRVA